MKFLVRNMKGFTLIELMVTMSIIVMITGFSLSSYLTFNENRQLDNDARAVNTLLNSVRAKAVFLEYPNGCSRMTSFGVASEADALGNLTKVKYFANCTSGVVGSTSDTILQNSYFSSAFNLSFAPQTGNLLSGVDTDITLMSTKGTVRTKKITVNRLMGSNNVINDEN